MPISAMASSGSMNGASRGATAVKNGVRKKSSVTNGALGGRSILAAAAGSL